MMDYLLHIIIKVDGEECSKMGKINNESVYEKN